MRNAEFYQSKGFYYHPFGPEEYFLFNQIGAQIFRMSKGRICNRGLIGLDKYKITKGG